MATSSATKTKRVGGGNTDSDAQTPITPTEVILVSPTSPSVRQAETAVSGKTAVVIAEANSLTISNTDEYGEADILLVRIRQARKVVSAHMDPIIEPIRKGLDLLYALRRNMDGPLDQAEKRVKEKMAGWQRVERDRIAEEQRLARQEEMRAAAVAREATLAAERAQEEAARATSAATRAAAQKQAETLAAQAEVASNRVAEAVSRTSEAERAKPVTGVGSRVTVKKVAVVTDMTAFIAAVQAGEVPEICLQVNEAVFKEYWEADRGLVSAWPGVEVKDVTSVGGR